jgi:hypothetical protein
MLPLRLPSTPEVRAPAITTALEAIRGGDPDFDSVALMRRVPVRVLALREALAEGDAGRLLQYAPPDLVEQWQGEVATGSPPAPGGAGDVQEVRLVWAEHGPAEDSLVLGIDCLTDSGEELQTSTEYWTLTRGRGERTPDVDDSSCPGCGAPVSPEEDRCPYCANLLPGPLSGWMLTRVDQEIDWYDAPPGFVV